MSDSGWMGTGVERPLTAVDQPGIPKRSSNTEGLLDCFGQPHRFFCHAATLSKVPQCSKTPGHITTGNHGGQIDLAKARKTPLAS